MEKKDIFKHKKWNCNIYLAILVDSSIIFLANDNTEYGKAYWVTDYMILERKR